MLLICASAEMFSYDCPMPFKAHLVFKLDTYCIIIFSAAGESQLTQSEDRANKLKQLMLQAKKELADSKKKVRNFLLLNHSLRLSFKVLNIFRNQTWRLQRRSSVLNVRFWHRKKKSTRCEKITILTQSHVALWIALNPFFFKLHLSELLAEKEKLAEKLRSSSEVNQKSVRNLESKVSSLSEDLSEKTKQYESLLSEHDSYKVNAGIYYLHVVHVRSSQFMSSLNVARLLLGWTYIIGISVSLRCACTTSSSSRNRELRTNCSFNTRNNFVSIRNKNWKTLKKNSPRCWPSCRGHKTTLTRSRRSWKSRRGDLQVRVRRRKRERSSWRKGK